MSPKTVDSIPHHPLNSNMPGSLLQVMRGLAILACQLEGASGLAVFMRVDLKLIEWRFGLAPLTDPDRWAGAFLGGVRFPAASALTVPVPLQDVGASTIRRTLRSQTFALIASRY